VGLTLHRNWVRIIDPGGLRILKMYMGTLGINIYFHSINCPTLTQFHCTIWMLINRVTISHTFSGSLDTLDQWSKLSFYGGVSIQLKFGSMLVWDPQLICPQGRNALSNSQMEKASQVLPCCPPTTLLGVPLCMRFCQQEFWEFPRLVGRYCSYLLPKQAGGTPQILVDKTFKWRAA